MNIQSEITESIQRLRQDKHDFVELLKSVILFPISDMEDKRYESASELYTRAEKDNGVFKSAIKVMEFFGDNWVNERLTEEEQLEQILSKINAIELDIIPPVSNILDFYKKCVKHPEYFLNTKDGEDTKKAMEYSIAKEEFILNRLKNMCSLRNLKDSADPQIETHSLLEILQQCLDFVKATVIYANEFELSKINVAVNEDEFVNHVLNNIKENINRHAFATKQFSRKHIWEKLVKVEVQDLNNFYSISIKNNGQPFLGKKENLLSYGYCYGENKHNGLGLNSAKQYMQKIGGDLNIETSLTGEYTFTYIIKIKK